MAAKQNHSATSRVRELLSYAKSLDESEVSSSETEDGGGEAQNLGCTTGVIDEVEMPMNYAVETTTSAHSTKCDMSSEVDRLASFKKQPNASPMNPTTLAKAGFFYVGPDDMVKCFSCNGKIKDWELGDSAIGKHKRFFPKCKFVQGKDQQNQPLLQRLVSSKKMKSTTEGKSSQRDDSYNTKKDTSVIDKSKIPDKLKSEYQRLLTFQDWPHSNPMQPRALAKAGFYYTQTRCVVKCFACSGEISNWKVVDVPMTKHTMFFPECPFVQGEDVGNEKLTSTDVMNAQHELVYQEPSTKLLAINKNESKNKSQVSQKDSVSDQWSSIPRQRPLTTAQHPQCENEAESIAPEAPFPARLTGTARPRVSLDDQYRENKEKPMRSASTATNLKWKLVKDDEQAKAETKTLNVEGTTSKCALENVIDFLDETNDEEGPMRKATSTTNLKRKMIEDDAQAKAGTKTLNVGGTTSNHSLECDELSDEEELMRNVTITTNLKRKLVEDDDHVKAGTKTLTIDGTKSKRKSEEAFLPSRVKQLLEEERNYLKCKICFELDVDVLFIPCQHLVICTQCECPIVCLICKKPVETWIKGYW